MISKRIIIPLIIMIIFAGISGVFAAKYRMEKQLKEAAAANDNASGPTSLDKVPLQQ